MRAMGAGEAGIWTSTGPFSEADPKRRRALDLDALSAILPTDRRDRLAQLLTDQTSRP